MMWLISLLMGRGLSEKAAGLAVRGIGTVIVIAALWGLYGLWHHRVVVETTVARDAYWKPIVAQRDGVIADQTAAALKAKAEADSLTATLQSLAKQIGDERAKAAADLDTYRRTHPVNVWVCNKPAAEGSGGRPVPEGAGTGPASSEAEAVLQPAPARNIGPALDALMAEADGVNEALRSCEVAYEAVRVSMPD